MAAPIQMTAETLNAKKGWPTQSAVDFQAGVDPSITDRLPPGTVVHVSSTLTFLPGVGNLLVMPMFTFQASDDPDVANDGGDPATQKGLWVAISPTGKLNALVANGAYELVSTNYDDSVSYAPNDHLTSPTTTSGPVTAGMLTKGTFKTNTICGVVSRGVIDNGYGADAISFWPCYFPHFT